MRETHGRGQTTDCGARRCDDGQNFVNFLSVPGTDRLCDRRYCEHSNHLVGQDGTGVVRALVDYGLLAR